MQQEVPESWRHLNVSIKELIVLVCFGFLKSPDSDFRKKCTNVTFADKASLFIRFLWSLSSYLSLKRGEAYTRSRRVY